MRTVEEIVAKLKESSEDLFDFTPEILVPFLPYEQAKPYLNADTTEEKWHPLPLERGIVLSQMWDYLEFAWEKAQGSLMFIVELRGLALVTAKKGYDHMSPLELVLELGKLYVIKLHAPKGSK